MIAKTGKKGIGKELLRDTVTSYLFLLPAFIFFFVFVLFPMLRGIYVSLFDYSINKFAFLGFGNYIRVSKVSVFI